MKQSEESELQELKGKLEENCHTQLRLYPNRSLLGKSRPLKFKSKDEYFDRRCSLFIECTYLLLRVEVQQTPAFISRTIFTNPAGEVYYFYSFDPQFQGRLLCIAPGNLVQNIISFFHAIFGAGGGQQLQDYEQQALLENTTQCLIPYFDELKEKSEKYYYQTQGEPNYSCKFKSQPSYPHAVLLKLESSDLYRDYNFPIKCATAVLVRGIIDLTVSADLQGHYVRLVGEQETLLRQLRFLYSTQAVGQAVSAFYLKIFRFLQLLQKEAFLKVTVSEVDLQAADSSCLLTFQSNLRRQPHINKTSNQKSSESSIRNDKELTKEQKEKLVRQREYLDNLSICKNRINFTVRIAFDASNGSFAVEAQAVSRWSIDEVYFINFLDFWTLFTNNWYSSSEKQERIEDQVKQMRFQTFHRSKNVGLRSSIKLTPHSSLIQALVLLYDKSVMLFLLFQEVLKKMYKLGTLAADFSQRCFSQLREPTFVESKVTRLRSVLLRYSQHYRRLQSLIPH